MEACSQTRDGHETRATTTAVCTMTTRPCTSDRADIHASAVSEGGRSGPWHFHGTRKQRDMSCLRSHAAGLAASSALASASEGVLALCTPAASLASPAGAAALLTCATAHHRTTPRERAPSFCHAHGRRDGLLSVGSPSVVMVRSSMVRSRQGRKGKEP